SSVAVRWPSSAPTAASASTLNRRGSSQIIGARGAWPRRVAPRSGRHRIRLPREAVADAAHGLDQRGAAHRAERIAQPLDVHVDRALLDEHVVAPDTVEQLLAAVH